MIDYKDLLDHAIEIASETHVVPSTLILQRDQHRVQPRHREQRVQRVRDQRAPGQPRVLLRPRGGGPQADAGAGHEGKATRHIDHGGGF